MNTATCCPLTPLVERPRVVGAVKNQFRLHDIVQIVAFAGAGKTAAASQFSRQLGYPVARTSFGLADFSCSRALLRLGRALAVADPEAPQLVRSRLDAGLEPAEVAAGLAEHLPNRALLILMDNAEVLGMSDQTAAAVQAFLDYLPSEVTVLIVGRDWLDATLGRLRCEGRVGRLDESDLAFDLDETRSLLTALGREPNHAEDVFEETRGWAAGIAFDLRPGRGAACPSDLSSYLNHEVLYRLPAEEQRFLLRTSMLELVTPEAASALVGSTASALLARVIRRALPITVVEPGGFVHRPWFRRFLLGELRTTLAGEVVELGRRHARLLSAAGYHETAVERLLEVDDLDAAAKVSELALDILYERGDWTAVARWLDRFGPGRVRSRPKLLGAQLRLLGALRRLGEAQDLIAELARSGLLDAVVARDRGVVATVGMSYALRSLEGVERIAGYVGDHRAEAVRYALRVISGTEPVAPPPGTEWGDVEKMLTWGLFLQGRLESLNVYLRAGSSGSPYLNGVIHAVLGVLWSGNLSEARALCDAFPLDIRQRSQPHLWHYLEAWIALAEGDAAAALDLGRWAVAHSQRTGVGSEPALELVVGLALLRLGEIDEAAAVLGDAAERSDRTAQHAHAEWANAYRGLALLRSGRVEDALAVLRGSVRSMRRSGRRAILPAAAVYLAEAEARAGNRIAAEEAALLAIEVAAATGAVFPLSDALHDLPTAEAIAPFRRWRKGLESEPASSARPLPRFPAGCGRTGVSIHVATFGAHPDIYVDGIARGVRRRKVIELAAYLAVHAGRIDRHRAQLDLFPEHDLRSGSNYFRQIVHQLRVATGVSLDRAPNDVLQLPASTSIDAVDCHLERLIKTTTEDSGAERLAELVSAVDESDGGYLPASDLEWVQERRAMLALLRPQVCLDASAAALDASQPELAERLAEQAIAEDPYSQRAYELLDAIGRRMGSRSRQELARRRAHQAFGGVVGTAS